MPAQATTPLGGPCIEITPTPDQYDQLCRDLKKLRRSGVISNTAAILEAVHAAAERGKMNGTTTSKMDTGSAITLPGPATGRMSS